MSRFLAGLFSAALALAGTGALASTLPPIEELIAQAQDEEEIQLLDRRTLAAEWDGVVLKQSAMPSPAPTEKTLLQPASSWAASYINFLLALTILVAVVIFISGLDDAFVDACYWLGRRRRRARLPDVERLHAAQQARFAIMVPAWKEHDVIAAMVENTVKTLDYEPYRIFCGVYVNDPATAAEVDRMVALYPDRVTRVDVPHPGPTCKADCLNYIVRHIVVSKESYTGIVLHDCEDVIHPLELKLFNAMLPGPDMIQLPVYSLPRGLGELTAGTYMDDFAESHGKDIVVRQALIGRVPGAGVATCYSAKAMAALYARMNGKPFNTATLTEDYDLSYRLRSRGAGQEFVNVVTNFPGIQRVIATHEYFPATFKAAYRQRARWVLGIAFQEWREIGWRGSALERYFLFRDRKAIVTAPVSVLAYAVLACFAFGLALGSEELRTGLERILSLPVLQTVLIINVVFLANRALQRMYFVGRYYGAMHAVLSLVRMPVNNFVNFFAVMRAWRQFIGHLVTGRKVAWDKTAHVFPTLAPARAAAAVALAAGLTVLMPAYSAPPPLTGPAYDLADQAYKAIEAGQLERAMQLATEALQHAPGHPSLLVIQADVLSRQKRPAEALERIRTLPASDLGAFGLAQRGYIWLELKDNVRAEADFTAAMQSAELTPEARQNIAAELAYLALARKDDEAALKWFQTALKDKPRPSLYADAGYAAMRLGRNDVAVEMLSKAVETGSYDPVNLYGMRRAIDSLSRRWGGTLSIGHSSTQTGGGTAIAAPGGDVRVVQAGAELTYTPETFGYRNGRVFQFYGNAFQALSANQQGYATGSDSRVAGLGARYKPLEAHNLVFGVERRFALGDRAGDDDWVLRAGWSMSGATDWNPVRTSWTTWQVYTEGAYFIDAERLIMPFDARMGRSFKGLLTPSLVVTPYLGIAGEFDKAQDPRTAAGIGPGLAMRYWFGETRTRAYPAYLDFSVQYRWRVTDARRGEGLFGQLALSF
jgi:adsorption protein B